MIKSDTQIRAHNAGTKRSDFRNHRIGRRNFLAGAAALSAAALLPSAKARATEQLNYIGWDGYDAPSVIGAFEAEHDVKINFESLIDSGGTFTKLAAGAYRDYDIVTNDVPWIQRMGAAGICEFLDPAEFADMFGDFYPQFQEPFEPLLWEGQITGIPTRWGWVGGNINTEFSSLDEWTSYAPVFDKKNRDKIGILDFGDWATFQVILYAGINPFDELDEAALKEVRKVFRALFENTRLITGDLVQAQRALLDGSALTFLAAGNYLTSGLRKEGHSQIVSFVPEPINGMKQGVIWLEATAIVKDPSNPELAAALLRHLVSAEAGLALAWNDWSACPVPNRFVEDLLTDEQKAVIQMDDMWTYFDRSLTYQVAPNVDDILTIWQEELSRA